MNKNTETDISPQVSDAIIKLTRTLNIVIDQDTLSILTRNLTAQLAAARTASGGLTFQRNTDI